MRLDVVLSADELKETDCSERIVAVIDVLRASTTIAAALDAGARAVIPFAETDELVERSKQFERDAVVLAGERKMFAISGFDIGNSPGQFRQDTVGDKTVLITTTNGTRALLASTGARDVVVAAYANHSAVTAMLRSALRGGTDVIIACAGQDGHFALEDAACAGSFVRSVTRRMSGVAMNDAAAACSLIARSYGDDVTSVFLHSTHGRALSDAGFHDDLAICGRVDAFPVVPVFNDRSITKLGPDRAR